MRHGTTHRLRFCDTDRLGHVNNVVFAVMLEQGRCEFAAEIGLPVGDDGRSIVIARMELDFVGEMTWPGDVLIETAVSRLGTKSFSLVQTLSVAGTVTGRAMTVLVVMDMRTHRSIPIDPWRERLAPWLADSEATVST